MTYAPAVTTTNPAQASAPPPGRRTIDQLLAEARARLDRLSPEQAFRAASGGAVLVDIRPAAQRAAEGEIPGALIVERKSAAPPQPASLVAAVRPPGATEALWSVYRVQ